MWDGRHKGRVAAAVVAAAVLPLGFLAAGERAEVAAGQGNVRPNIVVIQTDDQTMQQMVAMRHTQRLLGNGGTTFRRHYTNWPICCPARATLLTGQYAHNHGVLGNSQPTGGFPAFDNRNTTAMWLQSQGYRTAHVGKFMNLYGDSIRGGADRVPPGWDKWYTAEEATQAVYRYELNQNGRWVRYGARRADFKQDVFTRHAVRLIRRQVGPAPLYLQVDYTAPHTAGPNPMPQPPFNKCLSTAKPAARHAGDFAGAPLPRPPSFNEADVSDKPAAIQDLPEFGDKTVVSLTRKHRCRLESLLSVDEGVQEIIRALRAVEALANTFVIFTSDNGFMTGEHRITKAKTVVYDPASHVPLLIRGPGVPRGVEVRDLTSNADLGATVAEIGGAQPTHPLDGKSLLWAAQNPWIETGRELLIETHDYTAIRTERYLWVEHATGEFELYDMREDPDQLESRHDDSSLSMVRRRLAERLAALRDCVGETCRIPVALTVEVSAEQGFDGCAEPPVTVGLAGDDLREVDELEVFVDRQLAATDRENPFEVQLEREQLTSGAVTLRVRASLIDGRRVGWEQALQICE